MFIAFCVFYLSSHVELKLLYNYYYYCYWLNTTSMYILERIFVI